MKPKVTVNSKLWDKKIKDLHKKSKSSVTVGWMTNNDNKKKALKLEYGSPSDNQPARPFIGRAISDKVEKEIVEDLSKYLDPNVKPNNKKHLNDAADSIEIGILDSLNTASPALKNITIRRKEESGAARPSAIGRDTDDMISNIERRIK